MADIIEPHLSETGLVVKTLNFAPTIEHVMTYTHSRAINSLFCMFRNLARKLIQHQQQEDAPVLPREQIEAFVTKRMVYYLMWCIVGDTKGTVREELSNFIRKVSPIELPESEEGSIMDYEVGIDGVWVPWKNKVPIVDIDEKQMSGTDVVVPTLDTVRHVDIMYEWLSDHLPVILCGPPGSGKTMTLFSALRALPEMEVVGLNFSSTSTPELIMNTFNQYCEFKKTPRGTSLSPLQQNKWLVVFCDECNLPAADKYATVKVITFLRQLIEQNGFWRNEKHDWVTLERIQFVGACNPPSDPGRVPLSLRLLRHAPVVYVDYPGAESYRQIYGTFNRAILRRFPNLKECADPLTAAMVDFFMQTQKRFTADMQPFYIYSPREMTRWVKGVKESLRPFQELSREGLVRIFAHEALRLFQDRLVHEEERKWTDEQIDQAAQRYFPDVDLKEALARPILYSTYCSADSKTMEPVEREKIRPFLQAKLKLFCEEELDVNLVLFNEVLEHILRIDRVYRQNQGHLLIMGMSGGGKTTLARFVAWMNGFSIFQVKAHNKYTANEFDGDLRGVLRRAGTKGERMVFIMDEGGITDTAFLERMNTLLANGEVPGLFEGDEFSSLMTQSREGAQKAGLALEGTDELYKWFSQQVMKNLHVVFTMNPMEGSSDDKGATSPALYNRCVLNWYGDWSDTALYQVSADFISRMNVDKPNYVAGPDFPQVYSELALPPTHRTALLNAFVYVHKTARMATKMMVKREGRSTFITPRHFVEFINQFVKIHDEKKAELEEQQSHLDVGLKKIKDTVDQVGEMQKSLAGKGKELEAKNDMANTKLKQMMKDQQQAETKKVQSQALSKQLEIKSAAALEKKRAVEADLAGVEPAVRAAQEAVGSIQKKHLKEIQALRNPPAAVRLVCEAVCVLLGVADVTDWNKVRAVTLQDDFVDRVKGFNSETITEPMRKRMETKYTTNPECTVEKAYRASQACGPLMEWAGAQVKYAGMLLNIEPLRNELKALERDAMEMQRQADEAVALVGELERSITRYKDEYAALIGEAQAIKTDLATVKAKCDRSVLLIKSLDSERERWSQSSAEFGNQMKTIIGDALISGAFLAYSGYFNQTYRGSLISSWMSMLAKSTIDFKPDLTLSEFLSTADDRLRWKQNNLPADEMCTENAVMLQRFQRYPLIIDPAGQATQFILAEFAAKKITKTSFLDPNFRKFLEGALRFGTPLLVQDAESYDPILNPVLNRDVRKQAGRVLITVGDTDIDLSPAFNIILTTRNANFEFRPDICARVTLINFTVTRASLQTQCQGKALKSERPEVDKKRSDLVKLQSEFRLRLLQLEKSLLKSLNEAKGSLLDDDAVIAKLETIKKEAVEVKSKVDESEAVMKEIETTSAQYIPLALRCSAIFFTLQQMKLVCFLYKYSLQFFMDIFEVVLTQNDHLKGKKDYGERLSIITRDLFQAVFDRVSPGMLQQDRLSLAFTFARLQLRGTKDEPKAEEMLFFLGGGADGGSDTGAFASLVPATLNAVQAASINSLSASIPAFKNAARDMSCRTKEIAEWVRRARPEDTIPFPLESDGSSIIATFRHMLLIQALRPDRVINMCGIMVDQVLGEGFAAEKSNRLAAAVDKEVDPKTPILLCGVSGYDASTDVFDLAVAQNKELKQIAIGSAEVRSRIIRLLNCASVSVVRVEDQVDWE